ncbi:penicillin-binding protein 2 [Glycomyces halotolerans]
MNPALRRTGVVALALVGVLLLQVTWVQFFGHADYEPHTAGRTQYEEYEVPRGSILAGDVVIAQSLESPPDSAYDYYRDYPEGNYFGNITGFKSLYRGASAMEAEQNEVLNGSSDLFFLDELGSTLTGEEQLGGDVVLTIDADLQKAAYDAIADTGSHGGAVVTDPRTGQILAEASYPGWNPTEVASNDYDTAQAAWEDLIGHPDDPGEDRTRAHWYPPGSTFKTVVASAFIEGGHGDADTMVPAGNSYTAPDTDHEIRNSSDQCPSEEMTLKEAFAKSCNTTFARLCVETLSSGDIEAMAEAYGFGEAYQTPLDTHHSQTGDISADAFRAQACIGQQEVRETVVQNAVIAATIANGGERMEPQMIDQIIGPDGVTVKRGRENSLGRAISGSTAEQMQELMRAVVEEGTGSNARVSGHTVGGKTGTAEHSVGADGGEPDHGWFHGWALDEDGEPVVAVAVFLDSYGDGASSKAADISGDLMEQVLSGD